MLEQEGNIWIEGADSRNNALVCPINLIVKSDGRLVMGAGLALDFKTAIKDIDLVWGAAIQKLKVPTILVNKFTDLLGEHSPYVVGFPTKYDWRKPSSPGLILDMARQLVGVANVLQWTRILLPRLGCGLGGLDWKDIGPELNQVFDDRFIVINKKVAKAC